jgi:hypothetical protein
VIALIASADAPFVAGFRWYTPKGEGSSLGLELAKSTADAPERDPALLELGRRVLASGMPALVEAGKQMTLALPIHRHGRVAVVAALSF